MSDKNGTQKFYGVKITDDTNVVYYTEVAVKHDLKHTINVQTHIPINSKFPCHTRIGKPSYWSGTITGAFERNTNTECEHDYEFGDTNYRISFVEWLHNGLVKTLYLSESFVMPVAILSEITVETDNTIDDPVVKTTFQCEQCEERIK